MLSSKIIVLNCQIYFLKQGYAVLFLHRHRSLQPFFQRVEKNILDILNVSENDDTLITGR